MEVELPVTVERKLPMCPSTLAGVRIEIDRDPRMVCDSVDRIGQIRLNIAAVERVMQLPGGAAELGVFFHKMDGKTLIGQGQRGGHARHAAADDQRGVVDRHHFLLQRHQAGGSAHGHAHQVDGLFRGLIRITRMHPGALVSCWE